MASSTLVQQKRAGWLLSYDPTQIEEWMGGFSCLQVGHEVEVGIALTDFECDEEVFWQHPDWLAVTGWRGMKGKHHLGCVDRK
jgi:hypothetical protein